MEGILHMLHKAKKALSTASSQAFTLTTADQSYLLPGAGQKNREILCIYNGSDHTIYVGGSGLTTSNGFPIADTKYIIIPAVSNIYAICGSNNAEIRILELK